MSALPASFRPYRAIVYLPLGLALGALALPALDALLFYRPGQPTNLGLLPLLVCLLCLVFCTLAAALGLYRLRRTRRLSQRAGGSRETLLALFAAEQQKLPVWLVIMGLPMVLAAASLPLLLALMWGSGGTSRGFVFFTALALMLLGTGMRALWQAFRVMRASLHAVPKQVVGQPVSRADSPVLWQLVDDVVATAGVRVPDTIILGLDSGLFVTQGALYVDDGPDVITGCTLYLSLPYLAYLTRAEAKAVIAHELAHFSGEDTAFGLKLAPIYEAAWRGLALVRKRDRSDSEPDGGIWIVAPLLRAVLQHFLATFDRAVQQFSRERELAADRAGATAAGPQAAASALICITTLSETIERVLFEFTASGGRSPHADGLLAQVFAAVRAADDHAIDPRQHLEQAQPHPHNSHPPTVQRLQALGVSVDEALRAYAHRREPSGLLAELNRVQTPSAPEKTPSLSENLERHHSAITQRVADEEIAHLRAHLQTDGQTPDLVVRERGLKMPAICLAFNALFLSILVNQIIYFDEEFATLVFIVVPICLICLAGCSWLLCIHINHRLHPPLVLTAQGLRLCNRRSQPHLLRWENIRRAYTEGFRGMERLNLHLHTLPDSLKSDWLRGLRVFRKQSLVCLSGNALRLPGKGDLIDTLARYAENAVARARLAELCVTD